MKIFVLVVLLTILVGCAGKNLRENATRFAEQYGFVPVLFPTEQFSLFGLYKRGSTSKLHVYIEGDGHAWINRSTPSTDPTPHNPVALYLATNDPSPDHILYLARPCQYVGGNRDKKYWTNARMGEDVISSLDQAISEAKNLSGAEKICLVGFSGGGGCAILVAARRKDIFFLGTVAGNLNMGAWTTMHNLSPLDQSIEPMSVAAQVHNIPQRHYAGKNDTIIPPELARTFCTATGQPEACQTIPATAHGGAWQKVWNYTYAN